MSRPARKLFNWKLFSQLAKAFIVVAILALGCQAFYAFWFTGLRSDDIDQSATETSNNDDDTFIDPQQIFADFTAGSWRFDDSGDSAWDFRILAATPASAKDLVPTTIRTSEPDFDDQSVVDQFRDLGAHPKPVDGGFEMWETTGQGFTMTLFTHQGVVQLMRTQLPVEQGISTIEAIPRSRRNDETEGILLPLIAGAEQTAVRVDLNGRVTSAIIQLNIEKQIDIRSHWKENGWLVTPTLEFDSGVQSEQMTNAKFRCTKDGTIIEATFMSESDDSLAVIILTLLASRNGTQ